MSEVRVNVAQEAWCWWVAEAKPYRGRRAVRLWGFTAKQAERRMSRLIRREARKQARDYDVIVTPVAPEEGQTG